MPGNVDQPTLGATTVAGRAGGGGGTLVVPAGATIKNQLGSLLPGVVPGLGPVEIVTVPVGLGQHGVGVTVRVGVAVGVLLGVGLRVAVCVTVAVEVLVGAGWMWIQDSLLVSWLSPELVTAPQF